MDADELKLLWKIYRNKPSKERCYFCGRRMKFASGGLIGPVDVRESVCRSCGRDQPHWSDVIELTPAEEQILRRHDAMSPQDLPQCLQCGVDLQVTRDATTVFCMQCGRTWEADDLLAAMSPAELVELAGVLPFPIDQSQPAMELVSLAETHDMNSEPALAVFALAPDPASIGLFASFKSGLKGENTPNEKKEFFALYEDCVRIHSFGSDSAHVEQYEYSEIQAHHETNGELPFQLTFRSKKDLRRGLDLLDKLTTITHVNQTSQRQLESKQETEPHPQQHKGIADQLDQLAALHKEGLLSNEEFTAAKSRVLDSQ